MSRYAASVASIVTKRKEPAPHQSNNTGNLGRIEVPTVLTVVTDHSRLAEIRDILGVDSMD